MPSVAAAKTGLFVYAIVLQVEGIVQLKKKGANPIKYRVFFYGTHET